MLKFKTSDERPYNHTHEKRHQESNKTKVDTSSKINQRTTQVNQRSIKEKLKWIKNKSRVQDKNQEEFKTQEES